MPAKDRTYFNVETIYQVFRTIGNNLSTPVHGLLIGGGAMSIKGDKDATKDVDLVIRDENENRSFISAAIQSGFSDQSPRYNDYLLGDTVILVNEQDFHIDLFSSVVCGKLVIHDGILDRAAPTGVFGELTISLMSDEDLFLSKSVTERDRDLEDMYHIYLKGLRIETIFQEMKHQDAHTKFNWEAFMAVKLEELEERYQMTVPWKEEVDERAISEGIH
jgi:hypothetical protein